MESEKGTFRNGIDLSCKPLPSSRLQRSAEKSALGRQLPAPWRFHREEKGTRTYNDTFTLNESGNPANQTYSRTITGGGTYTRTDSGPGAMLSWTLLPRPLLRSGLPM